MKRTFLLVFLTAFVIMTISGCSGNRSALADYEAALQDLEDVALSDVFFQKEEMDLIIVGQKVSILSGNSGWEYEKGITNSTYRKEFAIAGYDVTVDLVTDLQDELISGVGYQFSNCDPEDIISILAALVSTYGVPDEEETDNLGVAVTYKWHGEDCFGFMMYNLSLNSVYFYSVIP